MSVDWDRMADKNDEWYHDMIEEELDEDENPCLECNAISWDGCDENEFKPCLCCEGIEEKHCHHYIREGTCPAVNSLKRGTE